ncbi:complement factor H-like [Lampris incognitus]|uniref:complement factor H-like n=1 Tax=Lampris incognitus TaxID=2546036 RepID=UPI0024B56255|nr:complement factor H-like [Lampris incognitus]
MFLRYLGLVLLLPFPEAVNAHDGTGPCNPPTLKGGYFVPHQVNYKNESQITYACDKGLKPAVEGWWATIKCQNGEWSHEPQCVDENDCLPLNILNAKLTEIPGRLRNQQVRIICDKGYEAKNGADTAECINAKWTPVLDCDREENACHAPTKIAHAVILQEYQDLFGEYSRVFYGCEDGYALEGGEATYVIQCESGTWTEAKPCERKSRPDVDTSGAHGPGSDSGLIDTSSGTETQPVGGDRERGNRPGVDTPGTHRPGSDSGLIGTSSGTETQPVGGDRDVPIHPHSRDETRPMVIPDVPVHPYSRDETRPMIIPVVNCGQIPTISYGVVKRQKMFLEYQCDNFHKLVGEPRVTCYNNRSWSPTPTCQDAFCVVNTAGIYGVKPPHKDVYLTEGEAKYLECIMVDYARNPYYAMIQCENGVQRTQRCCSNWDRRLNRCG